MIASGPDNEAIFHAARDIPDPDGRREYVRKACGGDDVRIAHVEALLAAAARPDSLLDRPAAAPPVATIDEPTTESHHTLIGPYKLIEQIGEGGMGRVWMAQQTEPVKRLVAVKLIKAGMDSKQVIARFEAERQALALMDHPNIARVLDGGTTSRGRPYFVMDLVKGVPITRHCDEHHLTPQKRLELFIQVCQAVQHAHQKGIIHRDLKPSNVLVALYDGKPVPKVIDFGVAKATGQQLTDKTLVTGFGAVVGTLEYISPEQAELNQLDIDTRSDIYSLGVLLYELLTGTTPLEKKRLKQAAMLEVLRVIREEEPPRPSTRLSTTEELPSIAAKRGMETKKLSKLVRGELDWIVMKALEKDRNRRYETANGFAQDIQRYLADEPVQACPPSAVYRLRKFARRNKGRLAVAGLILFFITLLGGGGGWVLRDREARSAAAARERLDRQERLTAQVELILEDVDRLEREQRWQEAQAAAERAATALEGREADEAVRQRVSEARRDLAFIVLLERIRQESRPATVEGKWNNAGAVRDYALAFRDYGVDVEALSTDELIARLRGKAALAVPVAFALDDWMAALRGMGEDQPSWEPLVALARGLDPDPLRDRIRAVWGQRITPELQAGLQRLAESIDVKSQSPGTLNVLALTLGRAQLRDSALRILRDGQYAYPADVMLNMNLANALQERKDHAGALRYRSVAVSLRPDSAALHANLGVVLSYNGKLEEAIAEYRKAIALDSKYPQARINLGIALCDQGKPEQAVAEVRQAIDLDPKDAKAHGTLGQALYMQRKLDEAIAEYRQAIALDAKYVIAHNNLGCALRDKGRFDEAIAEFRQAIALDPKYAMAHNSLGNALSDQGKVDEGIDEFRQAIVLDPKLPQAHSNLGRVLSLRRKVDEGIDEFRQAIALDPKDAKAHIGLGCALSMQGKPKEASDEFRQAIALDPKDALAHSNLGGALSAQGKLDEGIDEFRQAIALDPKDADAHSNLGHALYDQGKLDDAIVCCQKAIEVEPRNYLVHIYLGNAFARLGRWDQAVAPMDKVAELLPGDRWQPYQAATLRLQVGDRAGYRRICREMLERNGDIKDPRIAAQIAKTCLLEPKAVANLDRVLKLADRAVTGTEKHGSYRYFLCCKGLAEYRAGRHAEAVQWLERFAPQASGTEVDATAFAVLALAQHHLRRDEEALAALDRAEAIVAAKLPDPAAGRPFGIVWHDWLHCQVLLREAEELLKPDDARIHFYRGLRLRSLDKWPEAEAEYRQAIRLRPNWNEARYLLAVAIEVGAPEGRTGCFIGTPRPSSPNSPLGRPALHKPHA